MQTPQTKDFFLEVRFLTNTVVIYKRVPKPHWCFTCFLFIFHFCFFLLLFYPPHFSVPLHFLTIFKTLSTINAFKAPKTFNTSTNHWHLVTNIFSQYIWFDIDTCIIFAQCGLVCRFVTWWNIWKPPRRKPMIDCWETKGAGSNRFEFSLLLAKFVLFCKIEDC